MKVFAISLLFAGVFSSCSMVPEAGPSNFDIIQREQKKNKYPTSEFKIIDIKANNIKQLNEQQKVYTSANPPLDWSKTYHDAIRPYDKLSIHVIDTGGEGSISHGGPVSFGPIEVPINGKITIPYAGDFNAIGKEIATLQKEIQEKYASVFNSAEVSLTRIYRQPLTANVIGLVKKPGQQQLARAGVTLIDLVAMSGSTFEEPFLCSYLLHRNKKTYRISNDQMTKNSPLAQDGDLLEVRRRKNNSVTIMGAVRNPGNYHIPNKGSHISDFLGEGKGLDVNRANTTGIFVFRKTGRSTANIYRFDFSDPSGILYASQFYAHGGDVIFVTEAKITHWNRLLRNILPFDTISRMTSLGTQMSRF